MPVILGKKAVGSYSWSNCTQVSAFDLQIECSLGKVNLKPMLPVV